MGRHALFLPESPGRPAADFILVSPSLPDAESASTGAGSLPVLCVASPVQDTTEFVPLDFVIEDLEAAVNTMGAAFPDWFDLGEDFGDFFDALFLEGRNAKEPFIVPVVLFPKPQMERTSVDRPSNPWEVSSSAGSSTSGVVAEHASGIKGVTCAFHGLTSDGDVRGILGREFAVDCDGQTFPMRCSAASAVQDAAFLMAIEGTSWPPPGKTVGPVRCLTGATPGTGQQLTFNGCIHAPGAATFQGHDLLLPQSNAYRQDKVYTDLVTSPGDSGAGLIYTLNSAERVVGFAFETTSRSQNVAYSTWIWAESVFKALDLIY